MSVTHPQYPYDVYMEQMYQHGRGLAVWLPTAPEDSKLGVDIGYVGFMRMGEFRRIMDATETPAQREGRGDLAYTATLPINRITGTVSKDLSPLQLQYGTRRAVGASAAVEFPIVKVGAGGALIEYATEINAGAVLLTQSVVKGFDLRQPGTLRKWAETHLPSVFSLAKDPYDLTALEELILVTGFDAAEQYAMAVSMDHTRKGTIRFQVGIPDVGSCSVMAWGSWTSLPSVVTNSGPQSSRDEIMNTVSISRGTTYGISKLHHSEHDDSPTGNGTGTPEIAKPSFYDHIRRGNDDPQRGTHVHALFIRGYRLRKRPLPPRLKIKAAAGFHQLGEPDHGERGDFGLVAERTPEGTMMYDPLEPMFEYIFENSTADYALVHDEDAAKIISAARAIPSQTDASLQPNDCRSDWYLTLRSALAGIRPVVLVESGTTVGRISANSRRKGPDDDALAAAHGALVGTSDSTKTTRDIQFTSSPPPTPYFTQEFDRPRRSSGLSSLLSTIFEHNVPLPLRFSSISSAVGSLAASSMTTHSMPVAINPLCTGSHTSAASSRQSTTSSYESTTDSCQDMVSSYTSISSSCGSLCVNGTGIHSSPEVETTCLLPSDNSGRPSSPFVRAPSPVVRSPALYEREFPGTPPGADPQLWQWFNAVDSARSGSITAVQLQSALVNGHWPEFNFNTVQMLMNIFDADRSGTIRFKEFVDLWQYITNWYTLFRHLDSDFSGTIDENELADSLRNFGYNLSPSLLRLLERKFALGSAAFNTAVKITFSHFLRAWVLIETMTETFHRADTDHDGWIRVNREDFMSMTLSAP